MPKVLVADDEKSLLETFCELVSELGYDYVAASDGEEALAVAKRERPHLAVIDHMMPLRTGVEVIRAMRQSDELRHTPAILLSATTPRGREEAWRFLQKPVVLADFEQAVRDGVQLGLEAQGPLAADLRWAGRPRPEPPQEPEILSRKCGAESRLPGRNMHERDS